MKLFYLSNLFKPECSSNGFEYRIVLIMSDISKLESIQWLFND